MQTNLLTNCIETVMARPKTQIRGERGEKIKDRPGNDHHVVDRYQTDDEQGAVAQTAEDRRHPGERLIRTQTGILTDD